MTKQQITILIGLGTAVFLVFCCLASLMVSDQMVLEMEAEAAKLAVVLATWTTTPTNTPTATPTMTATPATPIMTATPLHTPTPTLTPSPTNTRVVSDTPVPTPTPTFSLSDMAYIPPGPFTMGSNEADLEGALALCNEDASDLGCERYFYQDEIPKRTTYLHGFYIDKHEVTNAEVCRFLNEMGNQEEGGAKWLDISTASDIWYYEGSKIIESDGQYRPREDYENHPVTHVSWYGARAYCEWAGKRLPTEAEWEKAARGTDGRIFPWGNAFPQDGTRVGNFADENHRNVQFIELIRGYDDGYRYTASVGTYPAGASPYGVLDMAGNVSEWCDDWYAAYQGSAFGNANFGTTYRIRRGGSYVWGRPSIRTSARNRERPEAVSGDSGFRCAVSLED
jgi:formylglycine-generating enzyme required for sulfatase activity